MNQIIKNMLGNEKCISCSNNNYDTGYFCYECFSKINFISNCNDITSIFPYQKPIKSLIKKLKYEDSDLYYNLFSNLIIYYLKWHKIDFDYIIPIPIDYIKLAKKSQNHNCIIAHKIAKYFNKKSLTNIIKKQRKTSQTQLKLKERKTNLKNAFFLNQKASKILAGKNIILFDDIITSGATLKEAVKILEKTKVKNIYPVTISKTYLTLS